MLCSVRYLFVISTSVIDCRVHYVAIVVCVRIFNTNNLWVSMDAMKNVVEKHFLHMEIIVNPKVQLITIYEGRSKSS